MRKDPLSPHALDLLNGRTSGGPLGADYAVSKEIALGDRLNEIAKIGVEQITCTGAGTSFDLDLGYKLAGARCVASIADLDGTALTVTECSDANASGVVTVTLSGAPNADEVVVSVLFDAR